MPNPYFQFKEFTVFHDRCAMKITTDGCLFGAWCATQIKELAAKTALDIGAGSGLLSLMVAQQNRLPTDAVELDAAAAAQAKENIAASPWAQHVQVHHADILRFTPTHRYDVIWSNPPFYETDLASPNALRNVAHHAGGLQLQALLAKSSDLLSEDGSLFLLLPFKREKEIIAVIEAAGFKVLQKITVHPSAAHAPFRLMLHVSKESAQLISEKTIFIKDGANNYTEDFIQLLKPYYLYL